MMKWLKRLPIFLVPIMAFIWIFNDKSSFAPSNTAINLERKMASISKLAVNKNNEMHVNQSSSSVAKHTETEDIIVQDRTPQSLQSDFKEDRSIVVSKGNEFISNVGAITKEDYSQKMGPIIHEHMGLVFFKTESNHNYIPVARNRMTNALYPISSIIHLKGVNEALRNNILGQGYSEHYYQPRIRFLSIKSEPSNIMKDYSDLKQRGYDVQLEVLTPHHKTFN